jgi:hypothetical protein
MAEAGELIPQDEIERIEPEGYPVNEKRVRARFLKNYGRKGRMYRAGTVYGNVPISVAKDLKDKGIVEPVAE